MVSMDILFPQATACGMGLTVDYPRFLGKGNVCRNYHRVCGVKME